MTVEAIETQDIVMRFPQQQGWKALLRRAPGKTALDHVNLTVRQGDIYGILGPNGAGKTTLVKVLCTLTIPTEGRATVLGHDVVRESLPLRRRLGVVYGDERTFFWRLSGLDNLIFYASLHGLSRHEARRRAYEVLELVGLRESADVRMHHYSSGMRQRTSIARGLISHPDLLVLDEPTRALDPVGAHEIRCLIKDRVATDGRTVLIATNIMGEAEFLCDRLAFINHGRVETTGTIDEIRDVLATEDIYELEVSAVGACDLDDLRRIAGMRSLTVDPMGGGRQRIILKARQGAPVIPQALRVLVEAGADVWSCERCELSVDEMFAALARRTPAQEREAVPA